MKLGAMQPYFFPYLGYFDLINCADRWIVADTVQYMKQGWVNRNRILNPSGGWQYIIMPTRKHSHRAAIGEIEVNDAADWRGLIVRQLEHYRKKAPFYGQVQALVEQCLSIQDSSLCRLNVAILKNVCACLQIRFEPTYLSELGPSLGAIEQPDDWALRMAEAVGADEYVNPPGGTNLYDVEKFTRSRVKLTIRPLIDLTYNCSPYEFVPCLSIIDVLMWNAPDRVKAYLDRLRE